MTGPEIKAMRERLNLTQAELAVLINVHRQTIIRAELKAPSMNTILRIKQAQREGRL